MLLTTTQSRDNLILALAFIIVNATLGVPMTLLNPADYDIEYLEDANHDPFEDGIDLMDGAWNIVTALLPRTDLVVMIPLAVRSYSYDCPSEILHPPECFCRA